MASSRKQVPLSLKSSSPDSKVDFSQKSIRGVPRSIWVPGSGFLAPLSQMQQGKVHSAVQVDCKLQDMVCKIYLAVMADSGLQEWKELMDCRCKLTRSSSGRGRRITAQDSRQCIAQFTSSGGVLTYNVNAVSHQFAKLCVLLKSRGKHSERVRNQLQHILIIRGRDGRGSMSEVLQ